MGQKDSKSQENKKMIGLTIAGFDPSGGAGILTDVKTLHSYNIHAITTLTAQSPKNVYGIQPVDLEFIEEQIDSALKEYNVKYAKTGLLYSKEIIKLVSEKITEYELKTVVDPVMVASSGDSLSTNKIAKYLKKYILPKTLITTPNVKEAEELSGIKINTKNDAIEAAYKIGEYCNVIITGGHLNGNNIIFDGEIYQIQKPLIKTENLHGTGCTFSASLLANLIKNPKNNLINNIDESLDFTFNSIKNGRYGTLNPKFY